MSSEIIVTLRITLEKSDEAGTPKATEAVRSAIRKSLLESSAHYAGVANLHSPLIKNISVDGFWIVNPAHPFLADNEEENQSWR
jgi:hypothetical protein